MCLVGFHTLLSGETAAFRPYWRMKEVKWVMRTPPRPQKPAIEASTVTKSSATASTTTATAAANPKGAISSD
ncbi:unnamed protein product [Clonostachys chloroleuca]|uniref:Uncharacterized protein n=1 Tax=Clonostachys chloroleuca TaxID=1926264 RepID=A0AA35M608_9HYPO|nr:unnamed protein product [Clonostachys chloroleuca]